MRFVTRMIAVIGLVLLPWLVTPSQAQQAAETVYKEPSGLYTVPIPTNWKAEARDGVLLLTDPDGGIKFYIVVVDGTNLENAINDAWAKVDPKFDLKPAQTQKPPPQGGVEARLTIVYTTPQDRVVVADGLLVKGKVYVALVDARADVFARRQSQVAQIGTGLEIAALQKTDLSGLTPKPVDGAITAELGRYIPDVMKRTDVPGAVVAIVQGGRVIYQNAFGVKTLGKPEPMNIDTQMMIGSSGKSLTTMMMATLVDDGKMRWDTPVQQILPSFAVADPALSKTLTMRNLVCACTGVPRRDLEWLFNASTLKPEDIVRSLSSFQFFTKFGEAFQYSNQMVASAGYISAVAGGASPSDMMNGYVALLEQRVTGPVGMKDTTLSFDHVIARGNYASPHGSSLLTAYVPMPLESEKVLLPVAPAGSHWSTAPDMARYLLTELSRGVAPDGKRVVSTANLEETWKPQVKVTNDSSYGLGWFVDSYKGVRLIQHGGNTFGFTSDVAFLPDRNLGIVVLANARASNLFNIAVRTRLLELVYDQKPEFDPQLGFILEESQKSLENTRSRVAEVEASAVTPFLGRYAHPALGDLTLSLEGGKLFMDAGEVKSELKKYTQKDGSIRYILADPPLAGNLIELKLENNQPVVVIPFTPDMYTFTRKP